MQPAHSALANIGSTVLIAALVLFILYRRFRRLFGRQKLREKRMLFRMIVLAAVCLLLLLSPYRSTWSFVAAGIGAIVGIALAFYATAHTKFEITPEGRFYRPNGYIGMIVTALFIGRLIYRFTVVYPVIHGAMQQAAQNPGLQTSPLAAYQRSPLTLGLYFLLAGYYIAYYAGILMKSRESQPAKDDHNKPKLVG